MAINLERRADFSGEVRAASNQRKLTGYAAIFDQEARIGNFFEVIRPGAFRDSLSSRDILALFDHDPGKLLARTKSGTLRLSEDSKGLEYEILLPDTQTGRDALALAERGDLGGMSFGFTVSKDGERWNQNRRELLSVMLHEISVVSSWPAYEGTSVQPRSRGPCPVILGPALFGDNLMKRILDRILGKHEERKQDPSWTFLSGLNSASGSLVNARIAEQLSVVLACVSGIATAMSSLPCYVYRVSDKGRNVDGAHPVSRLIKHGPNERQTWPDFIEWLMAQVLLRGNGLAEIVTDRTGRVIELKPVPWEWVSVQLLPNGRLVYDVVEMNHVYGGTGRPKRLLDTEVLHFRDRTDDGLIGRSRLQRAASVVQSGLSLQDFSNAMFEHGINPSGALEVDGKLGPEALGHLTERFRKEFSGTANAAKVLVLDQGLKWRQISVSPEDAELLASRRFSTEELARIFQVPPPMCGIWDHSSFTNSETAGRWFAQFCIGPWAKKLEGEFSRSVFTESSRDTHNLEFDLSGFLRGDHAARWQGHEIAVKNRILTPNEVRLVEGWNPRPGGDAVWSEADANTN